MTEMDFGDLPDDDPDLLENTALPKQFISRLRSAFYTRLSDFDNMDDIQMPREPGIEPIDASNASASVQLSCSSPCQPGMSKRMRLKP